MCQTACPPRPPSRPPPARCPALPSLPPCSLCYRILKRHITDLPGSGREGNFTVYDQVGGGRATRQLACLVAEKHRQGSVNSEALPGLLDRPERS